MKRLVLIAVFSFVSFSSRSAELTDFVVAKINNKAIASSEVIDRYRFVVLTAKLSVKEAEEQKILREQIIDKMVDEELIRQDAKNLKIEAGEKEITDGIELIALQRKQTPAQFKALLQRNNLSFESYSKQVETEILWSKIIAETLRSKVKVSDVEVREFFEQHKLNSDVRKFLLAEVLISPSENAAQLASKLAIELKSGADFKTIVKQFSSSVIGDGSGEIGWVAQTDLDSKIYVAISKLGKGDYSDSVQLADGYHIFKLIDSRVETKIADQDLNAAKGIIFNRKLQSLAKGYLMDLRKRAFVEIKN
jgi:peptidyl-prolyl cis-trans isomerase SurA